MPSEKYKAAMREALAQARSDVVMLETLEITSEIATTEVKKVDVCFAIDTSGSMGNEITWLADAMGGVFAALSNKFETVRFGLVSFGQSANNGQPIIQSEFTTDASTLSTILQTLTADGSDEPVFDTIKTASESLSWNRAFDVRRHLIVITDEAGDGVSDGNTATHSDALAALNLKGIALSQAYVESGDGVSLVELMEATEGSYIRRLETYLEPDIIEATSKVITIDADLEPIYMVQARQPYELTLENGETVVFEPVGFRFTLPGQNDQGVQDLNIAIDNVDRRIGKWIDAASQYDAPAIARYRPYLSTDLTTPQMDPPLSLVLSDLKRNVFEVSGRASVADIVNLKFLRELYLRRRFPSLGNT